MIGPFLDPAQWLWMTGCAAVSASLAAAFRRRVASKPFGTFTLLFGVLPAIPVALLVVWLSPSPRDVAASLDPNALVGWLLFLLAGLAASFGMARLFARRRIAADTTRIFD